MIRNADLRRVRQLVFRLQRLQEAADAVRELSRADPQRVKVLDEFVLTIDAWLTEVAEALDIIRQTRTIEASIDG